MLPFTSDTIVLVVAAAGTGAAAIIDLNTRLAVVDYDPGRAKLPRLLTACREAGFDASEYRVEAHFPKPIKLKGG